MGRAGGSYKTDEKTGEKTREAVVPPKKSAAKAPTQKSAAKAPTQKTDRKQEA